MVGVQPRRRHRGISVKVNALVDVGIAPLALSDLPVWTLDSCQGQKDRPAHVCFRYLGSEDREPVFFACLASAMGRKHKGESLYTLRLEWNSGEQPLGIIECSPGAIEQVARIVRAVSSDDRMFAYLHGKGCTGLRS
jgi:hypothetical protein